MSDFEQFGGQVFDRAENGRPARWKCGLDADGRRLDPPDIDGQVVVHRLAHEGYWEGVVASDEVLHERDIWENL